MERHDERNKTARAVNSVGEDEDKLRMGCNMLSNNRQLEENKLGIISVTQKRYLGIAVHLVRNP